MSIVTVHCSPGLCGYLLYGNGNLSIRQDENGKVYVKSGDTDEKEDLDGEVVIRGGVGENQWSNAPSGGAATATGTEGSVAGEGASATGNAEDGSALRLRLRQVQRALLPGRANLTRTMPLP